MVIDLINIMPTKYPAQPVVEVMTYLKALNNLSFSKVKLNCMDNIYN
jgi:hypothetical protein